MSFKRPGMPARGMTAVLTTLMCFVLIGFSDPPSADAGTFPAGNSKEVRAVKAKIRAAQFLSKATFGPTEETINALAARMQQIGYRRAVSEWIDAQFAMPSTSHTDVVSAIIGADGRELDEQGVGVHVYRYQAWWHIALRSPDQLRQRVAWALSQIFVISDSGSAFNNDDKRSKGNNASGEEEFTIPDWMGMGDYYDMLAEGSGKTYRELLGDVTWSPMMGIYLSSARNRKANLSLGRFPDENYAREIMQLFSVGLHQLRQDGRAVKDSEGNLIPTYDNEGIKELARVFTGFKYHHNTSTSFYAGRNHGDQMRMHWQEHDTNYNYSEDPNAPNSKTIFGVTLAPLSNVNTETCTAEVNEALDIIANHPNVAPFICRLLIQRLVKSNPSRAYMRRVTRVFNNNGQGVRGDMQAVVKAILTDPELYRGQRLVRRRNPTRVDVLTRGSEYSRLREPVNRITSLIRASRPTTNNVNGYHMLSHAIQGDLGQLPYRAPSVFNYYLPDYQPPGDLIGHVPSRRNPNGALFAPEFQVLTAVTANRVVNRLQSFCRARYVQYGMRVGTCRLTFNLDEEIELAKSLDNMDEILRRFDLLHCCGTLSEDTKDSIKDAVATYTSGQDNRNVERLEEMLLAVILSPDCAVEQ